MTTGDTLSEASALSLPTCAPEPEVAEVVLEAFADVLVDADGTVLVWTLVVILVGVEELAEIAALLPYALVVGESAFATAGSGQRWP